MKRLIPLVVLCAALCGCGKVIPADDEVAVVPLPERVVKGQGTFLHGPLFFSLGPVIGIKTYSSMKM